MNARTLLFIASVTALSSSALADEANDATQTAAARDSFLRGAQLVRDAQWAEALVAFEQSARIRKHATTTFNLGACQRAMGHYLLARKAFLRAIAENEASGGKELTPALAEETKQAIAELTKLEARFDVDVTPADVRVAIDGRPLEPFQNDPARPTLLGGTLPAGAGAAAPAPRLRVLSIPARTSSRSRARVSQTPFGTRCSRRERPRRSGSSSIACRRNFESRRNPKADRCSSTMRTSAFLPSPFRVRRVGIA
jgi:hypothetical protein